MFGFLLVHQMKRIKSDEIQQTIRNYVRHRNLAESNFLTGLSSSSAATLDTASAIGAEMNNQLNEHKNTPQLAKNKVDFDLMVLNDLTLIESSINNYYAYAFNSTSENEYVNQFELYMNRFSFTVN